MPDGGRQDRPPHGSIYWVFFIDFVESEVVVVDVVGELGLEGSLGVESELVVDVLLLRDSTVAVAAGVGADAGVAATAGVAGACWHPAAATPKATMAAEMHF